MSDRIFANKGFFYLMLVHIMLAQVYPNNLGWVSQDTVDQGVKQGIPGGWSKNMGRIISKKPEYMNQINLCEVVNKNKMYKMSTANFQ